MQNNYLLCTVCGYDYTHFLTSINLIGDDDYNLLRVSFDGIDIDLSKNKLGYPYRSQGNINLIFFCEDQHYFYKSFDGHKGSIHLDDNPIMDQLCTYLNSEAKKKKLEFNAFYDNSLKNKIADFFINYQEVNNTSK